MWTGGKDEEVIDLERKLFGFENRLIYLRDGQTFAKVLISSLALNGDERSIFEATIKIHAMLPLAFPTVLVEPAFKDAAHHC